MLVAVRRRSQPGMMSFVMPGTFGSEGVTELRPEAIDEGDDETGLFMRTE